MRKSIVWAVVYLVVAVGLVACGGGGGGGTTPPTPTANVSGYWKTTLSGRSNPLYSTVTQTGTTFSAQALCDVHENGPTTYSGSISGNAVSFTVTHNSQTVATCSGTVNGTNIQQGTCTDSGGTSTWTGVIQSQSPTSKECVIASVDVYVYQPWFLQSHLYDPAGLVSSATLSGTYLVSAQSFSLNYIPNPVYVNKWWTPSINLAAGATPAFPMNYTVTINFIDTTSQIVSQTVTTY